MAIFLYLNKASIRTGIFVCLVFCRILSAENRAWDITGTHTKIYLSNEQVKKISFNNLLYILDARKYHMVPPSIQIVPLATAQGPPLLLSASADPICQDPATIPPLLESFLSPFQPTGILSSPELPWYLLSFKH